MTQQEKLYATQMGIDTHEEPVVYMRSDCDVCLSEGFTASTRLSVNADGRSIIATLNIVTGDTLEPGRIGFSRSAWRYLSLREGAAVDVGHAPVVASLSFMRKKIYGHDLAPAEILAIIRDISQRLYSDVEIAGFLAACAGDRLSLAEVIELTRAMVTVGNQLQWPGAPKVFDKHCVGGLPGNRTTPIVIAIASAAGLTMPKTSSRAITSPAGTADTMEVLTEVDLDTHKLQSVVQEVGACLAWGGKVKLSPTDDLLIRIEKALDLDGEGQLVASVLSKKIAAGSTHVLIDIPVGPTAKVRDQASAQRLSALMYAVAEALQLQVHCVITDGSQTVGEGIGPVEEAKDVVAVLQNDSTAPKDLAERSVLLAGHLLTMATGEPLEQGLAQAREILSSGKAWKQFERICQAQGGLKSIPTAAHQTDLYAVESGTLRSMDNRRLAMLAKLAGAPESPVSGLRLRAKAGDRVAEGQPVATLFAATPGELAYALAYYRENRDMFQVGETS
ncbi:thymidine phosphorylase family protein [Marinimicrobium sp. ABcell2]|uniref:thymidine phosphorylase family protein n=1 Tax=Marinimicrobium sp. ABcell2 TaxID=3069751 RepID=UPI0027B0C98D|nr:thymidine phosphorylase family protein [Marinimicrobium sp. ABcell2]MDQ2075299.1 thymidine phosphorylase family protein [Marinimicrobium sp. ABcell2]